MGPATRVRPQRWVLINLYPAAKAAHDAKEVFIGTPCATLDLWTGGAHTQGRLGNGCFGRLGNLYRLAQR